MKVYVSIPNPLDDRRDDNSRRDHFPLHFSISYPLGPHHMLYDSGDKRGIWCERNYRRLPNLSADKLQMGSYYGRRLLRKSEGARYGHCYHQSPTRRGPCGPTHAGTVDIKTTPKGKEGGFDLHVRDWYHVWHLEMTSSDLACGRETLTHVHLQGLWHYHLPRPGDFHDSRPHKFAHARHVL